MGQKNSEKIDLAVLDEICQRKNYQVKQVKLPSIEEVQHVSTVLDISDESFLIELLNFQVFRQELEGTSRRTGLTKEDILAYGIALLEKMEELETSGKSIEINGKKII